MGEMKKIKPFTTSAQRWFQAVVCGGTFGYFVAITGTRWYFHNSPVTEAHLDSKELVTKNIPTALREAEIWRTVQDDEPDQDIVLASPTKHLKTSFYVANPEHPDGILQYVFRHPGEQAVTEVFHHVLAATKCDGLVLDIGANTGFYSMISLSEGCENVITFDPQPSCVRHIKHAFVRNGFRKGVVIPYLVDDISGKPVKLDASLNCAGRWPVQQHEAKTVDPDNIIDVNTTTLSDALPGDLHISLAKVDTEGAEYSVLLSMIPFLERDLVQNVIFEMTPMWWAPHHGLDDRDLVIGRFLTLVSKYNFNCWALDIVPWSTNDFYTKDNITSLALRINSTFQTDFWFCKDKFCW